jgi:capsular polysaccharide biosynthesis protein
MTNHPRRFPAPWPSKNIAASLTSSATPTTLSSLASISSPNKTDALRRTSKDEAWKIANGIAKLPELLDFV